MYKDKFVEFSDSDPLFAEKINLNQFFNMDFAYTTNINYYVRRQYIEG